MKKAHPETEELVPVSTTMSAGVGKAPLLKVRTVTTGITLKAGQPLDLAKLELAARFNTAAAARLTEAGFEVQTTRIATNSFEEYVDVKDVAGTLEAFRRIDAECERLGVGLFNAGPARSATAVEIAPDLVKISSRISASAALADPLDVGGASALAGAILRISRETEGGEGNFQFCASFNVPPGTPFFPAAYHDGGVTSFALGCETSALLAEALPKAHGDLHAARQLLQALFEAEMRPLEAISREVTQASPRCRRAATSASPRHAECLATPHASPRLATPRHAAYDAPASPPTRRR
jgi:hypothetical protein